MAKAQGIVRNTDDSISSAWMSADKRAPGRDLFPLMRRCSRVVSQYPFTNSHNGLHPVSLGEPTGLAVE